MKHDSIWEMATVEHPRTAGRRRTVEPGKQRRLAFPAAGGPEKYTRVVAETGVPAPVREFVAKHIESVAQLEVLLLLRAAGDKEWTPQEVAGALVIQPESIAASWLEDLTERRLAREKGGSYRYQPPREMRSTLDDLAQSYAKYRVTLVALIFSKPSDRITHFSDAFRIRRER